MYGRSCPITKLVFKSLGILKAGFKVTNILQKYSDNSVLQRIVMLSEMELNVKETE